MVRLDEPQRAVNVLSRSVIQSLEAWLISACRVSPPPAWLLLEGNGRGSFAAGANLSEIARLDGMAARQLSTAGQRLLRRIHNAPWPTAALVAGHALGGGLDLAIACDLIGATPDASFGHPGLARGFFTGWGGTVSLPAATKGRRGISAMLQAETLDARAACRAGLIAYLAPEPQLRRRLVAGLEQLATWPRPALEAWRVSLRGAANQRLAQRLLELSRVDTV
ncbi:MAG: enoyl-CoA hydratase/isomerase family protein [Acidobacteriota bacterium]